MPVSQLMYKALCEAFHDEMTRSIESDKRPMREYEVKIDVTAIKVSPTPGLLRGPGAIQSS